MPNTPSLPPPIAVAVPEQTTVAWPYWDKLPGVTPLALVHKTEAGGTYLVGVDDDRVNASDSTYTVDAMPSRAQVLGAFAGLHGVESIVASAAASAREIFSGHDVRISQCIVTDPELDQDVLRVTVDVAGLSRDEFRERNRAFDAWLDSAPAVDRVMFVASRRGDFFGA